MAQQLMPMFVPRGHSPGHDWPDDVLLDVQRQFIEQLPRASPVTDAGPCCSCLHNLEFRTGPSSSLRKRGTQPAKLPCGHAICDPCIKGWLGAKDNCPSCRQPFFLNPRWPRLTREGIREHYDRYWKMFLKEMRPILGQYPLSEHRFNFKQTTLHYDLIVLAQVFLNQVVHALRHSNMRLEHHENMDYANRVQDRFEQWIEDGDVLVRLQDNGWRPADAFDLAAGDPATADFIRRIGNLTAEFLIRARSVEFAVPVQNAGLFSSLVSWLFQVEGLDPNDHNGWRNQVITCMAHCLNHVAQDEDRGRGGWKAAQKKFLDFESKNGGPFPRSLKTEIRSEAGLAAIPKKDTAYVNENSPLYYSGQ